MQGENPFVAMKTIEPRFLSLPVGVLHGGFRGAIIHSQSRSEKHSFGTPGVQYIILFIYILIETYNS